MAPIVEGGDVVEPLRDRVLGRVVAEDVFRRATTRIRSSPATRCSTKPGEKLDDAGVQTSRCVRRSPANRVRRVRRATAAIWPVAIWSTSAKRSASSPRSRSVSRVPS
jgi:hypothetical protein